MEAEFLSLVDAAAFYKISVETLKARMLQGRHFGFIYVRNTYALGEADCWLEEWSEAFKYTRWDDLGVPIDGDNERKIRQGKPDRRPRYKLNGWVIFDAVSEVIVNGKARLDSKWILVPRILDPVNIYYMVTEYWGGGENEECRFITESDIYVLIPNPIESEYLAAPTETQKNLDSDKTQSQPTRLRSQREQNLLRVIAGLREFSDLPKEHNPAAEKLSMLFDVWGWDGPGKSTIADTILKLAADLPHNKT